MYPHHWGGGAFPRFYLVFVKPLTVPWSRAAGLLTPFVEVFRQKTFQLEAATVVQIVLAGGHAPEGNAAIQTRINKAFRHITARPGTF